ncbi:hypothetical protein DFH07DRAFT_1064674 [Mycena maculata]|uniref:Uncharacterized protein n=1 Tax=Mycena maculata TaxID=230809 RepID=A0AAD7IAL2_9AGAR|nr:hypothetical protein DFH07DRAFT_1064674 [Mycena maculata]
MDFHSNNDLHSDSERTRHSGISVAVLPLTSSAEEYAKAPLLTSTFGLHDCADGESAVDVVAEDAVDAFLMAVDPLQLDHEPILPFRRVPGNRLNVQTVPKAITLAGLTEDSSETRLSVPVTFSHLPNAPESPPVIHALASRKIIQDLEDGQHGLGSSIQEDADLLARTVQASIVRLGRLYSVPSSQTSLVAVDDSGGVVAPPIVGEPPESDLLFMPMETEFTDFIDAPLEDGQHHPGSSTQDADYCISISSSQMSVGSGHSVTGGLKHRRAPSHHTVQPLPIRHTDDAASRETQYVTLTSKATRVDPDPEPLEVDPIEVLARAQTFDGCFSLAVLSVVLNVDLDQARVALLDNSEVFATVLGMAFLRTRLGPVVEWESWEAMYDKARAFVEDGLLLLNVGGSVADLEAKAIALLA